MNQVVHNPQRERFELEQDGLLAVADYHRDGATLIVTHVGVPEPLRGQGLASSLAQAIVQHARAEKLKVHPVCSFMVAYFRRHPEERDLLG